MGFETLLGNERLKQNLSGSIRRGRISHFYLISGPEGSGKRTLARLLSAAILCRGEEKPCGLCNVCRKVLADTHPDVITVDDPEKKTVSVELVRKARSDIYIQPNESEHKIYLFPRAQDMGIPGQNALLKVLEEPPSYGVFILLTDNPEKLLPTVRSRCTELAMSALPDGILEEALQKAYPQSDAQQRAGAIARSGGYLGQAKAILEEAEESAQLAAFLDSYLHRDAVALLKVLVPMEKWKRDVFAAELQLWMQALQSALTCRYGMAPLSPAARQISTARSANELKAAIDSLRTAIAYAQQNVSVAAICGYLEWQLR